MTPALPEQLDDLWSQISRDVREDVGDLLFDVWLAPLRPVNLHDGRLTVQAPDTLRTWVTDRFGRLLQASTAAVLGPEIALDIIGAQGAGALPERQHPNAANANRPSTPTVERFLSDEEPLNPKLDFVQFVIGASNQLAHAAALTVAELPAQAYNPLFLCGPPGVGKTHLLHAIGNYVRTFGGGLTVRYTTTERFTSNFVSAIRHGHIDTFKSQIRRADVLLVDDVQFLASKTRTEEEFFHTFNALQASGAQLVLTSDRPPADLDGLEDRLRERFAAGLVCPIDRPEEAMRRTILRKRIDHDGIEIGDPAALEVIASRITDNVRTLEGALIRVVAFHSLTGRPITPALADEVLDGLYPTSPRFARTLPDPSHLARAENAKPSIDDILRVTCDYFDVTRADLLSSGRSAAIAWPRQVAMYLAREVTDESLPSIGRSFGGRNHTTVMHAHRRATARIETEPDVRVLVDKLTGRLWATAS